MHFDKKDKRRGPNRLKLVPGWVDSPDRIVSNGFEEFQHTCSILPDVPWGRSSSPNHGLLPQFLFEVPGLHRRLGRLCGDRTSKDLQDWMGLLVYYCWGKNALIWGWPAGGRCVCWDGGLPLSGAWDAFNAAFSALSFSSSSSMACCES